MTFRVPKFISNGNLFFEKQQASILSAATIITSASLLSGVMGLVRNRLLVAYFYGNPYYASYFVAFKLPDLIFQLLVMGALSAAFIPVFTKYEKQSKKDAFLMASSVLNMILLAFMVFSSVIFVFATKITGLITGPGFTPDQIAISAQLTRIMIFSQFFFAISNFLSGTIQSYKRFIIPALSPIAYNIGIIIGTVLFSPSLGIYGPAIGVVIGAFLHFSMQIPLAIKLGFRYYPRIDFSHPGVREMYRLMAPRTLSISIDQIEGLALTFFAAHISSDSVVLIGLAQSLMTFPIRLFGAPIGQAALPFLSKESNSGNMEGFKKLVFQSLNQISFFAMPASVILLILRIPIVRFSLGASNFPWTATVLTAKIVAILTFSIATQAMVHLLIRAFYALHDTKHPFVASLLSTAFFLLTSTYCVFFTDWGILGLATTLSCVTIFEMFVLIIFLNKQIHLLQEKEFWLSQLKMVASSFLMAVFIWLPFRILDELIFDTSKTVDLIGLTLSVGTIGMLTYIVFAYLFDIKELSVLSRLSGALGNWKNILSKSTEVVETAGQSDEASV